jgi:predicted aconitase with swiveling domain
VSRSRAVEPPGRRGQPGEAASVKALVTRCTLFGWGGVDPRSGTVIERRHELAGKAPVALLFNRMTTKVAPGAVVLRAPAMTERDQDLLDAIRTGDHVVEDANAGIVQATKRG